MKKRLFIQVNPAYVTRAAINEMQRSTFFNNVDITAMLLVIGHAASDQPPVKIFDLDHLEDGQYGELKALIEKQTGKPVERELV